MLRIADASDEFSGAHRKIVYVCINNWDALLYVLIDAHACINALPGCIDVHHGKIPGVIFRVAIPGRCSDRCHGLKTTARFIVKVHDRYQCLQQIHHGFEAKNMDVSKFLLKLSSDLYFHWRKIRFRFYVEL